MEMDEKLVDEIKPKISRSGARHLRRKRLITARKIAGTNANVELNLIKVISDVEEKPAGIHETNEIGGLTKSKARRLRRKSKIVAHQSQASPDNSEIQSANSNCCSLSEDSHADAGKTRMELLENAKNLSIRNTKDKKIEYTEKFQVDSDKFNSELIIDRTIQTVDTLLCNKKENIISNNAITLSHATTEEHDPSSGKFHRQSLEYSTKMNDDPKSREQVKAEREAKKAAKAAAKNKTKSVQQNSSASLPTELKVDDTLSQNPNETNSEIIPLTTQLSKVSVCDSDAKNTDPNCKNEGKSKSELRAERRLKQEAQRAAKQEQLQKGKAKSTLPTPSKTTLSETSTKKEEEASTKVVKKILTKESSHEINLFKHLYHEREQAFIKVSAVNSNIHPAIIRLGVQYANKIIVGSNARCIALLSSVKQLIEDFERPAHADFTRGLEASLQESSSYLNHCRPLAVSMHNALRHLKWQMSQLPSTIPDDEAKSVLCKAIDIYVQEQITLAAEMISIKIRTKISNNDVILTYGFSSLIQKILCDAYDAGHKFRVVVVDGRPWLEGRELLRRLANHGIECSYVLINALSFIMPEVNKVFLGAHAILANGAVMARAGTAQVALMAKAFNVPVLVSCEMHKSSERVQTDSIVYNEIDNADELIQNCHVSMKKNPLVNWRAKKSLNLLNITYDVTPANLVTGVVTELAILPCSSVPVILRIKPSEI